MILTLRFFRSKFQFPVKNLQLPLVFLHFRMFHRFSIVFNGRGRSGNRSTTIWLNYMTSRLTYADLARGPEFEAGVAETLVEAVRVEAAPVRAHARYLTLVLV